MDLQYSTAYLLHYKGTRRQHFLHFYHNYLVNVVSVCPDYWTSHPGKPLPSTFMFPVVMGFQCADVQVYWIEKWTWRQHLVCLLTFDLLPTTSDQDTATCACPHLLAYVALAGLDRVWSGLAVWSMRQMWCSPAVITPPYDEASVYVRDAEQGYSSIKSTWHRSSSVTPLSSAGPFELHTAPLYLCEDHAGTKVKALWLLGVVILTSRWILTEYYGLSAVDLSSPGDHVTCIFSFLSF